MNKSTSQKNTLLQVTQAIAETKTCKRVIFSGTKTKFKNQIFPSFRKNNTLPTHNPTDKNEMTETIDILKGISQEKKEGQLVTGGRGKKKSTTT